MKKALSLILLLFGVNSTYASSRDAIAILTQTAQKLNSIHQLQYHYARDINNIKNNSFSKAAADCYLEFGIDPLMQVTRFQFRSDRYAQIYNGTEYFTLNEATHEYEVMENPAPTIFNGLSYFYNSMASLRSTLPAIIADDSIGKTTRDTSLNGKTYNVVTLAMHNKALDYLGSFRKFTIIITLYYDLIIDRETSLPYQVLEHNNNDGDGYNTRATYTQINTQPTAPAGPSWFYSTYKGQYHPKPVVAAQPLIAVGTPLPDWQLPAYNGRDNSKVQAGQFKNQLVLMDFWIKNCSFCMESFKYLKALQQQYGSKVQILAVNAYDPEADIAFFYRREKPAYQMLYQGEVLSKKLGISGYPVVVLADKAGKVIYAGNFNKEKLEQLIKANTL